MIRAGICALTLLLLLGWTAAPAPADNDPGPALAGTPVTGTRDPAQAPMLAMGRHLDHLPKTGEVHYRIPRTESGSTFHVAVLFVGAGNSVGEGIRLKLGTTPGDQGCGSSGVFRPTLGESAPVLFTTVSTWTDEPEHECALASELSLSILAPNDPVDGGREVEVLVFEEPPLSAYAFGLLATPEPPQWTPLEPAPTSRELTFGTTPTNTPVVRDGTYDFTLRPGHTVALAAPLDWDQSLQAQIDAVLPRGAPATDQIRVEIVGPLLGTSNVSFTDAEPVDWSNPKRAGRFRTGAQSRVVAYANRDSYDAGINTEALAGMHYVLIHWTGTGDAGSAAQNLSVPATLTLRTSGVAGNGIPGYTEIKGLIGPQPGSRLIDGTLQRPAATSPAPRPSDDSSGPVSRTTVLVIGGVVALGLLILLARASRRAVRRRRRTRATAGRHRG